jgi:phosphoglycerol transferase MdoB-like AlkP superfamily enzyme
MWMKISPRVISHRFGPVVILALVLVTVSLITRIILFVHSIPSLEENLVSIPGIFLIGLFFDLVNASYFCIPLVLYLWITPGRIIQKKWHTYILLTLFFIFIFILFFNASAEWFFWDEFNTRFNFIAVDYLVYTTEVLGNIRESYPIFWIISGLLLASVATLFFIRRWIIRSATEPLPFKKRSLIAAALLFIPLIAYIGINTRWHHFSKNAYANELAGNGMYELFAAYFNNELNYNQFYQTIDDRESFVLLKQILKTKESKYLSNDPFHFEREIRHEGPEKKLNVVMISVESLSADFLRSFGNTKNITPFLDSLADHSLFFTNVYATGTRTVRGLEALSLCIPPTPGQSIVRRPHNENLFTLGKVFEEKGYESKFIYGGYGYFDNMGYFFSNNSYTVADRNLLSSEEIDYENVWGVADENLFTLASREISKTVDEGKPIFAHIMTTSNHRPFTYPEGRIDIPSHSSRDGAVKYTDYAIGKFINRCRKEPWFNNTIFVIVADHCASSAGKTELPVNKYHIPLLIYSPAHVQPGKFERLMSQIDLGPTLLGMLNFNYTSKFLGYDMFALEPGRERAFISTYQTLGYIKGNKMVILSPKKKTQEVELDLTTASTTPVSVERHLLHEAIAWYQASSYAFKEGLYK